MKFLIRAVFLLIGYFSFGQDSILKNFLNSNVYQSQMTGVYLYDPLEKKELFNYNGDKYFTPASNTKIFTLFAAIKLINDSIPAFKYTIVNDNLHIQGTGDPTFYHPKFNNPKVIQFLKNNGSKIVLHWNNFTEDPFVEGWTWDDFRKNYSPERSQFPINENLVTITKSGNNLNSFPSIFQSNIKVKESKELRDFYENNFYIGTRISKVKVPFIVKDDIIRQTLIDIVGKPVEISYTSLPNNYKYFYSLPKDPVLKEMMEQSDNFLAEQLLLLASNTTNGNLGSEKVIKKITTEYLANLAQKPIWKDGSGLSRYNLFSPQSIVQVLDKMFNELPEEKLFSYFPVGGKTGTLKNRYKDLPTPYLYAKTGSLSNAITLSGYLKTKSGKTLIFSLMNNNFVEDASKVRNENEKFIKLIRDLY